MDIFSVLDILISAPGFSEPRQDDGHFAISLIFKRVACKRLPTVICRYIIAAAFQKQKSSGCYFTSNLAPFRQQLSDLC